MKTLSHEAKNRESEQRSIIKQRKERFWPTLEVSPR